MLLVIDIGNTNLVFALTQDERILAQWRIRTDRHRTADEYAVWLLTLMAQAGFARQDIRAVSVSSVVPDVNFAIKTLVRQYLNCEPRLFVSGDFASSMKVLIDQPRELGADRLINAFAAWEEYRRALIVLDFGTATTFDVVSGQGEYLGGVIAPGINLSLEALERAAAKLHGIAIARPARVVGSNTTHAMQSGIFYGYTGLIEGIVARIKAERAEAMFVVATGGLAPLYAGATGVIDAVAPDLTIRGLMRLSR